MQLLILVNELISTQFSKYTHLLAILIYLF